MKALAAMGWFFFNRFLTETAQATPPEPVIEEDYFTSPEMDLI